MKRLAAPLLLAIWLLAGCVIAPKEVILYNASDAVIISHLKRDRSYVDFDRIAVWAVGDRKIGPTYVGGMTQLAPGNQALLIHYYTKPGIGPEFEAYVPLSASLPVGARLRLNGKTDGSDAVVWLEDATSGAVVGGTGRGPMRIAPRY